MTDKQPPVEKIVKKDLTFRLLKPGRQFATNGPNYDRPKDPINRVDDKKKIDAITKNSFVPYQLIIDNGFKDDQVKKIFESDAKGENIEVFEVIPKKYLKPVLPKGLGKRPAASK